MNINDEALTEAYTSLGMMRAAQQILESSSPQSPMARPIWHEALKLLKSSISEQWKYTDIMLAASGQSEELPQ